MASNVPRWFHNIKFGTDLTNAPSSFVSRFKAQIENELKDFTFESTGPILEETSDPTGPIVEETSDSNGPIIEEIESPPASPVPSTLLLPASPAPAPSPSLQQVSLAPSTPQRQASPVSSRTQSPASLAPSTPQRQASPVSSRALSPASPVPSTPQRQASPVSSRALSPASPVPSTPLRQVSPVPSPPKHLAPLRRSSRRRWAPLDFARGERPIYRRAGPAFEVIGFEEGFPEKNNYGRKSTVVVRMPKNANQGPQIEWRQAKKGDYQYYTEAENDYQMSGFIRLEPGATKPETKASSTCNYKFHVRTGSVIMKIDKQTIVLNNKMGYIKIKPGSRYSIKNLSNRPTELHYVANSKP